jgi:hypothetical protein
MFLMWVAWFVVKAAPLGRGKGVKVMRRKLATLLVVVFTLACLIIDACSPAPVERYYYDFDDAALDNVEVVNLSPAEEAAVRGALRVLLSPRCTAAFSRAGLRSPLEVITEEGVVLRPSVDLFRYSSNQLGLVSDATRRAYCEEFSSCRSQAGTVSARLYGVRLTTDGRARVFFHETAFYGESWLFGKNSLHDVLVHEFMHVGGQPPTPGWFFQHDLAGFEHYGEIMSACR